MNLSVKSEVEPEIAAGSDEDLWDSYTSSVG